MKNNMNINTVKTESILKIYEENNECVQLKAKIISVNNQQVKIVEDGKPILKDAWAIMLDKTIFHPQGGGQPSDKGTINGIKVLTVREDKMQFNCPVYHFIEPIELSQSVNDIFKIGAEVNLQIDEHYRKKCAISHTAGHLLADVLEFKPYFSSYKAKPIQGHHFPGSEYIKVIIEVDIADKINFIKELNAHMIEAINNNTQIQVNYCDAIRYIKIGESSRMCGGTHLSSTKNISSCTITKVKTSKSKNGGGNFELTIYYNC